MYRKMTIDITNFNNTRYAASYHMAFTFFIYSVYR